MKKSLIALAVAGAFAAPAFAASSNVDFYGQFRVSVDHLNNSIGWGMNDETSRIGFKGAEDLGGGLKAIYQWESGFNAGTNGSLSSGTTATAAGVGGLGAQRDTFVGLSGDFGTVIAGRHDTPYKMAGSADLFADTLGDAQNTGARCIVCEDLRVTNAIAYVSPDMSGLSLVGAIVPGNFTNNTATTKSLNNLSNAYSLAAMYNNGPLKVTAGYENLGAYSTAANLSTSSSQNAWKLNGAYTIGDLKLSATYEKISNAGGNSANSQTDYLLSAAYGMGPITLAAQYGKRDPNGAAANNMTDTTVGVVYGLSKRTSTYLAYAHYGVDSGVNAGAGAGLALNAFTMGMNHSF